MSRLLLLRSTLLLMLVAPVAAARGAEPAERNIYLSDHPGMEPPLLYVAGRIVTVLRFEQPCDPTRTKMLGWEGRFEPVVCTGTSVLLVPLHDLKPEDRFLLLVTLADGTELPFTVTSRKGRDGDRSVDQQVNVFRDHTAPHAVLASLRDSLEREQKLREENERYRREDSVNHALAALLAKGAEKLTPLQLRQKWLLKSHDDVEIQVSVLTSRDQAKAAVVFNVRNNSTDRSWQLMEARLWTESREEPRPFALRSSREQWGPGGENGKIAVVMDMSAFDSKTGPERLVLELFRGDGLQQAYVLLEKRMIR
ncbi:DUF2381 family protein [Archangium violaceum]|uniref:DUF2381 family protein n=1 Tax=Archangium violaceum TaxID=83451 RepID=UPI00193BE02B|nr:DUF2381 family protein [Archangium violaceum]QRK10871.1 DUF2381 family protein [Archangium violaceum]